MHRKTRRAAAAVAVIGALVAGGAAFTAANTFTTPDVAGSATQAVTGAVISDQHNNLSSDGTEITSVDLTFAATQAGHTVRAGFSDNTAGLVTCTNTDLGAGLAYNCLTPNVLAGGANQNELTAGLPAQDSLA